MARIRRAPPGPPPDEDPTAPIGTRAVETETVVPPPPPEAPPPREIWPWLLALVLVALAIIGAVLLLTHRGSSTKRVPDVVGLSGRHAVRRLSADGFRSRIAAVNSSKPKDIVIAQAPQAGAKLSKGGTVALTVSAGPAKVVVPSVTGSTVASAIQRIHAAHLVSRQIPVFAAKAKGTVVSQKPAAGTAVKKNSTVVLNVSKGPQLVSVPDVVGKTRSDAAAILRRAGLVAAVFSVPSSEPRGTVIAQKPAAPAKAAKGSRVRLNVSQGQPATTATTTVTATATTTTTTATAGASAATTVPSVVGLKQAPAQRKLHAAGLAARTTYVRSSRPAGTVVRQQPTPGSSVPRGTRVAIAVSTGPKAAPLVAVPDVTGEDQASATSALQAAGFKVLALDQPTDDPNEDGVVLDEDPAPGTRAPRGSQVTILIGRFSGTTSTP
jgi:serine/threonine-protein kinase